MQNSHVGSVQQRETDRFNKFDNTNGRLRSASPTLPTSNFVSFQFPVLKVQLILQLIH